MGLANTDIVLRFTLRQQRRCLSLAVHLHDQTTIVRAEGVYIRGALQQTTGSTACERVVVDDELHLGRMLLKGDVDVRHYH